MTTTVPRLNVSDHGAPDELMLASELDRDVPTWLVQLLVTHVTTVCDACHELIDHRERAYYENGVLHPTHVKCWLVQLTARPVRIVSVKYRGTKTRVTPLDDTN